MPELLASGHVSPSQEGRTRKREEDHGEMIELVKSAKLQALGPVNERDEGTKTSSLQISKEKKIESFVHQNEEEGTSKITEATTLMIFDKLVHMPADQNPPSCDVTVPKDVMEKNSSKPDLLALDVDLNDPFYPYKKLGQVGSTDPSECGSTTGPVEIDESMRKWNEMKRNGFVSTSQAKTSIPRVRKCQHTKIKGAELKKKVDTTKQDISNINTKVAAPNHFLSGLNPGIVKHVRNSKQVNSIIKAMLQNELPQKQETGRHNGEFKKRNKELINGWKEYSYASAADHLGLSLTKPLSPCSNKKEQLDGLDTSRYENCDTSKFSTKRDDDDDDDDDLTLKLSSSITMASEHAISNAEFSLNHDDITSLSTEAATVALKWLELIQSDIKARLATLKRSKNRVKNAILKELPCIFLRDLHPERSNESIKKETPDQHLVPWKALFSHMEELLIEEEEHLEKWLRQVEELKAQCQEGLKYVYANGFSHLKSMKDLRVLKSQEACERECAVRAAAASIYSTCNMIMTT